MLEEFRGSGAVVMAIPAGGVPVAAEIARALGLPLDLAIVSKITLPWDTEAGYGAVAWDGTAQLNEEMRFYFLLSDKVVDDGIRHATEKVQRRVETLRGDRPMAEVAGRAVILVDDGLASGFTMKVAIEALRREGAARIIVAVPTAPAHTAATMEELAEEVYCANVRDTGRFAVAAAYREWHDVSEREAKATLDAFAEGQVLPTPRG